MSKVEMLHEIQGNIQEINFFPSEAFVIYRVKNVYEYIKHMENCKEIYVEDKKKVSTCLMERHCPHEIGMFNNCKEKDTRAVCLSEQVLLEKCVKQPVNQLMNILGKHKLY